MEEGCNHPSLQLQILQEVYLQLILILQLISLLKSGNPFLQSLSNRRDSVLLKLDPMFEILPLLDSHS